jgi:phenylpropionate dioxygenase-like ring-hydroxylating dioxygenase large terminal subunit
MNDWARTLFDASRDAVEGRAKQRGEAAFSPVARYLDPQRHERELAALRRLPIAAAPSDWLREAGDWVARTLHGVPVLLLRGADGALRAFVNVCRHRGAELLPDGQRGSGRQRVVCPYHSWSYGVDGGLLGRPHGEEFPQLPRERAGLVALPVAERCGFAWVVADARAGVDWDDWFGPLGAALDGLGYGADSVCTHERRFEHPANWKLPFDGNLETYHFQYAHRETIAHLFHDNLLLHEGFAHDHQRLVLPKRGLADLEATALDAETLGRHCNVIHFFFPATFVLWEGDHVNAFAVTPLAPDRCKVDSWLLAPREVHQRRRPEFWQQNHELFWRALDEDFALAASIQRGLASGANDALAFGTSEFPAERFERAVERLIGA